MDECIKHPRLRRDDRFSMSEQGHGRDERRTCYSMGDMKYMHRFARQGPGMRTVGCIISERYDIYNHTSSSEYRYFIYSLPNNAEMLLKTAREHWNVENNLHWHMESRLEKMMIERKTMLHKTLLLSRRWYWPY